MVPSTGVEPVTFRLGGAYSIHFFWLTRNVGFALLFDEVKNVAMAVQSITQTFYLFNAKVSAQIPVLY